VDEKYPPVGPSPDGHAAFSELAGDLEPDTFVRPRDERDSIGPVSGAAA
jgi:hypothetical protein